MDNKQKNIAVLAIAIVLFLGAGVLVVSATGTGETHTKFPQCPTLQEEGSLCIKKVKWTDRWCDGVVPVQFVVDHESRGGDREMARVAIAKGDEGIDKDKFGPHHPPTEQMEVRYEAKLVVTDTCIAPDTYRLVIDVQNWTPDCRECGDSEKWRSQPFDL